jgi:signal transduction histidine kinase
MLYRESSSPDQSKPAIGESGSSASAAGGHDPRTGEDLSALVLSLQQELRAQRSALEASQTLARQTELALDQAQSELRLVSAALMTAQEMERKRIASELHDSIGQSLNALSFGLGIVMDVTRDSDAIYITELLEKLSQQIKDTVEEVRRIAMDLRPAILDDLGIVGTLSWFFREFRTIHPRVALRTEIDVAEGDVPVTLRTPIYRVVQEALNNVLKHASASEIRIVLSRRPPSIVLEIQDNGRGFAVAGDSLHAGSFRAGMGLTGMRDRVEFSGGDFALHSAPGAGTHLRACWPLYFAEGGIGEAADSDDRE